jgi:hypothetical protein
MNLPKINLDLYLRDDDTYRNWSTHRVECEVLTIHLKTGTMRIRFKWLGKNETRNVETNEFWKQYELVEKK